MADGRVNGSLNLSRALGDMEYKQSKELGPEEQVRERELLGTYIFIRDHFPGSHAATALACGRVVGPPAGCRFILSRPRASQGAPPPHNPRARRSRRCRRSAPWTSRRATSS